MGWTLRIRFSGSVQQLHDVDESASLQALRERIASALKTPADAMRLMSGFPPRPLSEEEEVLNKPLTEVLGLRNCTTLVVTSRPGAAVPTAASDAPQQDTAAAIIDEHARSSAAGTSTEASSTTRRRGKKPTQSEEHGDALSWQEGLAQDVLRAVDGSAVTASLRDLRRSVKDMMLQAQAQRRAYDREEAARAGKHEVGNVPGEFTLSGISRRFRVTFPISKRKTVHEDYPKLPGIVLRQLFMQLARHPDHRENLRPFNMALTSPSVFWNVVRLKDDAGDAAAHMDLEQFVQSLAPGVDWSFMQHRIRNLSAKALENKRMEEEQAAATKRQGTKQGRKAKGKGKGKGKAKAKGKGKRKEKAVTQENSDDKADGGEEKEEEGEEEEEEEETVAAKKAKKCVGVNQC